MSAPPSQQILTRIAEERDSDIVELPHLYKSLDPEWLDTVIESLDDGGVSFTYAGFDVDVTNDVEITLSSSSPGEQA